MTLFTAEGLLRAWSRAVHKGIGPVFAAFASRAYLRWLLTQDIPATLKAEPGGWLLSHPELFNRRAPGRTCVSALQAMKNFDDRAINHSKGCGGVMRAAPVGMFFSHWDRPADTFRVGVETAAITHGHPTGFLTAGVLAVIISGLLREKTLSSALAQAKEELIQHPDHGETLRAIEQAEQLALSNPKDASALSKLGQGWIAEEALAIAIYSVLSTHDLESAVILAVNHDGDSDSTGSIAGNIAGSLYGAEAIPQRWLDPLELRELIETVADDLFEFYSNPDKVIPEDHRRY